MSFTSGVFSSKTRLSIIINAFLAVVMATLYHSIQCEFTLHTLMFEYSSITLYSRYQFADAEVVIYVIAIFCLPHLV